MRQEQNVTLIATLESSKKKYGNSAGCSSQEDCGTKVKYKVEGNTSMTARRIKCWCPKCGEKHMFTVSEETVSRGGW